MSETLSSQPLGRRICDEARTMKKEREEEEEEEDKSPVIENKISSFSLYQSDRHQHLLK